MRNGSGPVRSGPWRTIAGAAAVAGTLDLLSAFMVSGTRGATTDRVLQSVASGLLGKAAFSGGTRAAALGFAAHYGIMLAFAAFYILASRNWPLLRRRPLQVGAVYGLGTFFVMNYGVVPASAAAHWPNWDAVTLVHALIVHVVFVGMTIAWFARSER